MLLSWNHMIGSGKVLLLFRYGSCPLKAGDLIRPTVFVLIFERHSTKNFTPLNCQCRFPRQLR